MDATPRMQSAVTTTAASSGISRRQRDSASCPLRFFMATLLLQSLDREQAADPGAALEASGRKPFAWSRLDDRVVCERRQAVRFPNDSFRIPDARRRTLQPR